MSRNIRIRLSRRSPLLLCRVGVRLGLLLVRVSISVRLGLFRLFGLLSGMFRCLFLSGFGGEVKRWCRFGCRGSGDILGRRFRLFRSRSDLWRFCLLWVGGFLWNDGCTQRVFTRDEKFGLADG